MHLKFRLGLIFASLVEYEADMSVMGFPPVEERSGPEGAEGDDELGASTNRPLSSTHAQGATSARDDPEPTGGGGVKPGAANDDEEEEQCKETIADFLIHEADHGHGR